MIEVGHARIGFEEARINVWEAKECLMIYQYRFINIAVCPRLPFLQVGQTAISGNGDLGKLEFFGDTNCQQCWKQNLRYKLSTKILRSRFFSAKVIFIYLYRCIGEFKKLSGGKQKKILRLWRQDWRPSSRNWPIFWMILTDTLTEKPENRL